MSKIVISGYYGFKNAGDEAMLAAMIEVLSKLDDSLHITVISGDPQDTIKRHGVRAVYWLNYYDIAKAIKNCGKTSIGWNIRSLDTVIIDEKKILKRITKNLKKGDLILLHDTSLKTYNVLVELLLFLEREKYSTFTLDTSSKN